MQRLSSNPAKIKFFFFIQITPIRRRTVTIAVIAIASQLTRLMNGRIDVQSEVGKGSSFCVTVPFGICKTALPDKDKNDDTDKVDFKKIRILLVEDNDLNRELATVLLGEAWITVETAENGQTAVDAFLGHEPYYYDAILMDVMMPVMDGLSATRAIRASSAADAHSIPVIAMTANAFEEDIRKTQNAGMNAHLSKPIVIKEVLKVLASFVSAPKTPDTEDDNPCAGESNGAGESDGASESDCTNTDCDAGESDCANTDCGACANENPERECPEGEEA